MNSSGNVCSNPSQSAIHRPQGKNWGSHVDHVSERGDSRMSVVTHLVSDSKVGFLLLQLLTACLVLQHGPHCLLHPGNKQDYKFTNALLFEVFSGKCGITKSEIDISLSQININCPNLHTHFKRLFLATAC